MINGDNFSIIPELVNSVAIVYGWKDFYTPDRKKVNTIPKDTLLSYTGKYLLVTDTLSVTFCNDNEMQLCARQNNQPADGLKMIPTGNREFSVKEMPGIIVRVLYNNDGKVEALEIDERGNKTKAVKIN